MPFVLATGYPARIAILSERSEVRDLSRQTFRLFNFPRHKALQGLPATFDRTQPTPRFSREQFGGSLGGPFVPDKLFGFLNMEYLYQDHAVPIAVRRFSSIGTGMAPTGGSAQAFVHDFRLTSKGDWVPDEKDHVFLRYAFERSLDVDNGFLTRPAGSGRQIASSPLTATIPFSSTGREIFHPVKLTPDLPKELFP